MDFVTVVHRLLGSQPVSGTQLPQKWAVLASAALLCADRPQGRDVWRHLRGRGTGQCVLLHSQLDLGCDCFSLVAEIICNSLQIQPGFCEHRNVWEWLGPWQGDAGEALVPAGGAGPCKKGHLSSCSILSAQRVLREEMSTDNIPGGEPREVFWGSMMSGCGGNSPFPTPTVPTR